MFGVNYFQNNLFTEWWKNTFPWTSQLDPFGKLKETTDIYKKFYEFYENFNKNFFKSAEGYDVEKFSSLMKEFQEKYNNLILSLFGLNLNFKPSEYFEKIIQPYTMFFVNQDFIKPIKNVLSLIDKESDRIVDSILKNKEFEKYLKTPSLGITREFNELIKKLIKSYIEYIQKLNNFRKTFTKISQESFEKFIETIKEDIRKGEKYTDFDKLFRRWIEINEDIFIKWFKSKEFCEALGEYIKGTSNLKKTLDEYVYVILKDTNIATKTELDRAYKEIYELKKELREIKKNLVKEGENK